MRPPLFDSAHPLIPLPMLGAGRMMCVGIGKMERDGDGPVTAHVAVLDASAAAARAGVEFRTAPADPPRRVEHEVLLCVARRAMDPWHAGRLESALRRTKRWELLLALAERNGLTPLLHRHLTLRAAACGVPASVMAELSGLAHGHALRGLGMAAELRRLAGALAAAGVRAAAYKGPALAVRAYGDAALRPCADLDLLVAPEDVDRAAAALAAQGYAPALALTPARERCFRRADGDYPFVHGETGALLELHCRAWTARLGVDLPAGALLERAVEVQVGGGAVPALADGDLALALAVHGAKHRWERLEWLASFAELLRGNTGVPEALVASAARVGARRAALLALGLAAALLDAFVPPALLAEAEAEPGLPALAAEAEARIFREPGVGDGDDTAARLLYGLRVRDGLGERARYAYRWLAVPSPEDWGWLPLPDALFPAYRVLRPLRLLLRHARPRR